MSMRLWSLLPWASKSVLAAGLLSTSYLLQPGDNLPTRFLIHLCVLVGGILGFREVMASGGRLPQLAGMSQPERLVIRTAESVSMVLAILIMLRVI